MSKKILVIDGHPDPDPGRFVHALAGAYAAGAERAGHEVSRIEVASLDFDFLRSAEDWMKAAPSSLKGAQAAVAEAEHLVFVYPLWLGAMPALLKGFLEQISAGGAMIEAKEGGKSWEQKMKGKSARVIVTMGMPSAVYRLYFGAHSLKSFERNMLKFSGANPVYDTIIGMVDALGDKGRKRVIERIEKLGEAAR